MSYEEWIEQGRPHWTCWFCNGIFVTIPPTSDFVCPLCQHLVENGKVK